MTLLSELKKREKQKLIKSHSDKKDLTIFEYTPTCMFEHKWDKYTSMARGLILNNSGKVVARPFKKFFEISQTGKKLEEHIKEHGFPKIEEKIDGSLGILFWYYDQWNLVTKGNLTGRVGKIGKEIFDKQFRLWKLALYGRVNFNKNATHLFEIVSPENKVVVDYGDTRQLYYLTSICVKNGREFQSKVFSSAFPKPKTYEKIEKHIDNAEGYVLHFPDNFRVKVKFEEYKRLHGIITNVSVNSILYCIKNNISIDKYLISIPDEAYNWINRIWNELQNGYKDIENYCKSEAEKVKNLPTQKERALAIFATSKNKPYSGIIFNMLNGYKYDYLIWKTIKPKDGKYWK